MVERLLSLARSHFQSGAVVWSQRGLQSQRPSNIGTLAFVKQQLYDLFTVEFFCSAK